MKSEGKGPLEDKSVDGRILLKLPHINSACTGFHPLRI
jgi:hypothetical protein